MNRVRVYSDLEIKKLLQNPNVVCIKYKKQIEYSNSFKLWAVMQKIENPDKTARQIFEEAGFDMSILSDEIPRRRILDWTKLYKKFGVDYFNKRDEYTFCSVKKNSEDNDIKIICNDSDCLVIVMYDEEIDN